MFIKSLFWQFINSIIKILLEVFVFNRKIRRILKGNWAKFYLKKYIKKGIKNSEKNTLPYIENTQKNLNKNSIIWQYWESPNGEIPPLVQACLNSVKKYKGNYERILLTPNNVKEYVKIPEIFWKLKEKGIIKTAFFSDILRTCLLIQNGGIWIDATVLLTEDLPEHIKNAELFVFQNDLKIDLDGLNMASYFIASKSNNKILKDTLSSLIEYWNENNFLINYFTFLHAFTMVTQANLENKNIYNNIPFFNFLPVQQLQGELLNPFSSERWEQIKKISPIHKLTHKQSVLTKKKELNISGTFYEHIIEEYK